MHSRAGGRLGVLLALLTWATLAWADATTDQAKRYLEQKNPKAAFDLLLPLQSQRAGEIEYDYLLGIAALDAGDAQTAVFALERVLAVNPNYLQARAEIARAYFVLEFTERLIYLPDTLWSYGRPPPPNERPTRESLGLPRAGFVFAALHNGYKIRPEIFGRWMTLLKRVDGSVLWVLARREAVRANLQREAARHGVDPGRLVFAQPVARDAHLARQPAADLFLDTLEYGGGATCLDALWSGLPVLACPAGAYAGRQSASALAALGLDDLIATGSDDYIARAARLATDPGALADVRVRLAVARDAKPLFDMAARVRELEAAFDAIAGRWGAGLPPAPLAVDRAGAGARFLPAEA